MKIVQFEDGKWALRRFNFWGMCWEYRDLVSGRHWWPSSSPYIEDCLVSSEEDVRKKGHIYRVKQVKKV